MQKDCYACTEYNYDWFVNDLEEPYTTAEGKPFSWQGRTRVVGGRTNVWGRQSYRFCDLDFKAASFDGFGEDWPLSYADLAPYYDMVEDYVGHHRAWPRACTSCPTASSSRRWASPAPSARCASASRTSSAGP